MWESIMRHKITYLHPYPKNYLPFNKGVLENLRKVFFHNEKISDWEMPDPADIKPGSGFNIFENQYYSCC